MFKSHICIRQHDITDCGAACLAIVARFYGLKVSIAVIREYAGTDRRATNILGMLEAARRLGLDARGVKCDLSALGQVPFPSIAHVIRSGALHYVVVHSVTAKYVIVADPAQGIVKYAQEAFRRIWTGALILLKPGVSFHPGRRSISVWRRFGRLLMPHRFLLLQAFLATVLVMLLGLGTSIYIQLLVDNILVEKNWTMLRWLSVALLVVTVTRALLGSLRSMLLARIGKKLDASLMTEYYRRVVHLPMRYFDMRQTGEIISRFNDVVRIRNALSGSTLVLFVDAATMVAGFGVLCVYSISLALASLAIVPAISLIVYLIGPHLKRAQRNTLERAAILQAHLVEGITGIATLKAFGAEEKSAAAAGEKIDQFLHSLFRATAWGVSANTAADTLTAVATVLILWSAGSMVIQQEMTTGQMVAFQSALLYLLQPILRLVGLNQAIQDAVIAAGRLGEILDIGVESNESEKVSLAAGTPGKIEFVNVSFRYGMRQTVLQDINLCIAPRSLVAIVGQSGSGKTTLARLLLRYYDPVEGRIEIDGLDLGSLCLNSVRAGIGYLSQDPFFFNATIEENLLVGNPDARSEAVEEALQAAGLEAFVAGLPDRGRTYIGERGLLLSSGERQRLAIARVLLQNPRVLIFDEATNNLDSLVERAIVDLMESLR